MKFERRNIQNSRERRKERKRERKRQRKRERERKKERKNFLRLVHHSFSSLRFPSIKVFHYPVKPFKGISKYGE